MAKRERSKAYPFIALNEAITLVEQIRESIGRGPYIREDIIESLGYNSKSGSIARKVAALVHYGLLKREGSDYEISELTTRILTPRDDDECKKSIIEAFESVDLFIELISRYSSDGRIPAQLENRLVRDHGISNSAKTQAADTFRSSAEFAGIISTEGIFISETKEQKNNDVKENSLNSNTDANETKGIQKSSNFSKNTAEREIENLQQFRISLSGGKVMYMEVPSNLSQKDIAIIKKNIELLELQVDGFSDE